MFPLKNTQVVYESARLGITGGRENDPTLIKTKKAKLGKAGAKVYAAGCVCMTNDKRRTTEDK